MFSAVKIRGPIGPSENLTQLEIKEIQKAVIDKKNCRKPNNGTECRYFKINLTLIIII